MTQESVNVFLNDLKIQLEGVDILFKYVDDTNIVIPLWKDELISGGQFLTLV